jgi:putative transposase
VFLDATYCKARVNHRVVPQAVVQGAAWQRCRVHFLCNVLARVPKAAGQMVASIVRTSFAQPDAEHVTAQLSEITRMLQRSHPKVAAMHEDAGEDITAFRHFPTAHRRQIWSTNPLERVNSEQGDQAPHRRRRGLPTAFGSPTRPTA